MKKIELDERLRKWFIIIGENVRRRRGGMSEIQFAKNANVSRGVIRAIEKGKSINFMNLIKIADALHVNPPNLFITDIDRGEVSFKQKLLMDLISNKDLGE